ncbi:cytochrome P450 26B1-like isoform X1 [Lampetra fluviatilis]
MATMLEGALLDVASLLASLAAGLGSALLLLLVSQRLWAMRWAATRDPSCKLPLPGGSMGLPLIGESLHWMVQGPGFHASRRARHGNVFKTHLLGRPVVRVTGAQHVRRILMGEHALVSACWPASTRMLLGSNTLINSVGEAHRTRRKVLTKVFSRAALESYAPGVARVVRAAVREWRARAGAEVRVYPACQALMFRVAVRVLLGLEPSPPDMATFSADFTQFVDNIFSLPVDLPFSGLRKGLRARDSMHKFLESTLSEKLASRHSGGRTHADAIDYMLESAREQGVELSAKELKEAAVELIFAAYSTTASACTSLVLLLLTHPEALAKLRAELRAHGLPEPPCCGCAHRDADAATDAAEGAGISSPLAPEEAGDASAVRLEGHRRAEGEPEGEMEGKREDGRRAADGAREWQNRNEEEGNLAERTKVAAGEAEEGDAREDGCRKCEPTLGPERLSRLRASKSPKAGACCTASGTRTTRRPCSRTRSTSSQSAGPTRTPTRPKSRATPFPPPAAPRAPAGTRRAPTLASATCRSAAACGAAWAASSRASCSSCWPWRWPARAAGSWRAPRRRACRTCPSCTPWTASAFASTAWTPTTTSCRGPGSPEVPVGSRGSASRAGGVVRFGVWSQVLAFS